MCSHGEVVGTHDTQTGDQLAERAPIEHDGGSFDLGEKRLEKSRIVTRMRHEMSRSLAQDRLTPIRNRHAAAIFRNTNARRHVVRGHVSGERRERMHLQAEARGEDSEMGGRRKSGNDVRQVRWNRLANKLGGSQSQKFS